MQDSHTIQRGDNRLKENAKKILMGIIVGLMFLGLWSPTPLAMTEDQVLQERFRIREMAREALSTLYEFAPGARYAVEHAAGYGVFSTFGIKIFFAGGTTGKGFIHNNRTERFTYMKMLQVQGGLGLGISKDRIIWVFETQNALRDFIKLGWDFGGKARVSAMVQNQGGMFSGAISVAPGVYLYQLTNSGLAAELTITGTKYLKDDDLN
jgi:lipid-binding SYLF domain-containing protein